jgi:hypothetical protein
VAADGRSEKKMKLPDPPLVSSPARNDVRRRWIGRKVRISKRHLNFKSRKPEDDTKKEEWKALGVGTVLDVGRAMWLFVHWSSGVKEQVHKMDIDVVK